MFELFTYDQSILSSFSSPSLSAYRPFFYVVTQLGSSLLLLILSAAAFAMGNKKIKIVAAVLAISILFGMVVTDDIKNIIKSPRPAVSSPEPFLYTNEYSFPSGHSVTAFMAASIIGAYFGWKYRILGYLLAISVGVSRLSLGVHYPSDVLAGAILGIILGEMAVYAAYQIGLHPNTVVLSRLLSALKVRAHCMAPRNKTPVSLQLLSVLIAIAMIAAIVFYYLGGKNYSLGILAISSMILVLVLPAYMAKESSYIVIFSVIAIGLISGFAELFLSAEAISIVILAFTYIILFFIDRHTGISDDTVKKSI